MKHYLAAAALLALVACSKKDNPTGPPTPPVADTTKLVVNVFDATQWTKDDPYGKLRSGVTVTLYKSQEDFNAKRIAYETKSNEAGKALFANIPAIEYYIVAKLDTLSSIPVATSLPLKGYSCDTLYQQIPDQSAIPANNNFPYPGNFIYRDLNADGKLDANDMVILPADHIKADSAKTITTRILIGVAENSNYKPFATGNDVKTAITALYADLHAWHQQHALLDAVYTDDAACTGLTNWCQLDNYTHNAADQQVSALWNTAYSLIARSNRLLSHNILLSGVSASEEKIIKAEARVMRAYLYEQLATAFSTTLQFNTISIPFNITLTSQANTRALTFDVFKNSKDDLPHLTAASDRSRLSYEACLALYTRATWDRNNPAVIAAACLDLFANTSFKAATTNDDTYKNAASTENLWCGSTAITNTDVTTVFKKGSYLPEIHYAEILLLQAVYFASVDKFADAAGRVNILRLRNNTTKVADPVSRAEAIKIIRQQYKIELSTEGLTLAHISHQDPMAATDLVVERLMPLPGFRPEKIRLPIPQSVLDHYRNIYQNVGY
jgi:hypothetical protein